MAPFGRISAFRKCERARAIVFRGLTRKGWGYVLMHIRSHKLNDLSCLCHGTTFDAFPSFLKGSLKPASHVDPSDYRHPRSRSQRPEDPVQGSTR